MTSTANFVADRNERRNITKGQKAMGRAILFPEDGGKGGRGKKSQNSTRQTAQSVGGFGAEFFRQARTIKLYSPELARHVRDGTMTNQRGVRDDQTLPLVVR